MKRKSYYFLFVLYILMLGFILYINGVFTGEIGSISNFTINLTFFILIGILMIISAVFFNRLNRAGDALERVAKSMSTQYEVSSANLWSIKKKRMYLKIVFLTHSLLNIRDESKPIQQKRERLPLPAVWKNILTRICWIRLQGHTIIP